jgi:hypothetical protein
VTQRSIVEAHIYGADGDVIDLFTAQLPEVEVTSAPVTRGFDVAQVLELSGNAVTIVTGLLAIKAIMWPPKPHVPPRSVSVVLRNVAGDSIELEEASEEELRQAIDLRIDPPE